MLEALGWNIYRIWSTDWFRDTHGQTAKMLKHLEVLRAQVAPMGELPPRIFA